MWNTLFWQFARVSRQTVLWGNGQRWTQLMLVWCNQKPAQREPPYQPGSRLMNVMEPPECWALWLKSTALASTYAAVMIVTRIFRCKFYFFYKPLESEFPSIILGFIFFEFTWLNFLRVLWGKCRLVKDLPNEARFCPFLSLQLKLFYATSFIWMFWCYKNIIFFQRFTQGGKYFRQLKGKMLIHYQYSSLFGSVN